MVSRLREQQGHRLLGGRQDVGHRRVDHHDAKLRCLGHVDVVQSDAGASDHDEVFGHFQRLGINLRGGANDERVCAVDGINQLFGRKSESHVHVVARVAQFLQPRLSNLFRYQYTGHRYTFRLLLQE